MKKPLIGVGAVVFLNDAVLLVKRKFEPAANKWAIPGGKLEFGETLKQAAEREVFEETGIRIEATEVAHIFEWIDQHHYVILDLDATYISGELSAGDDALDVRWVSASELNTIEVTQSTRDLLTSKYNFL